MGAFQQEKPGVTQCDTERHCETQLRSLIGTLLITKHGH